MTQKTSEARVAAIVGPYASGKTSLLESLLYVTGAIDRKGTAADSSRVGDASPEARKRQTSVETVVAGTRFLGEQWVFLDCPGSAEFAQETYNALTAADVAVVVCDPDPARAVMAMPLMKFLEDMAIPHMVFINKVENTKAPIREIIDALQAVSSLPLVLREVPIRENGQITGFVDLISERAYRFQEGEYKDNISTHLMKLPEAAEARPDEERQTMMESLADHNDELLEKILEDAVPAHSDLFNSLSRAVGDNMLVPVFFGAAEQDAGVFRLLKALRHDVVGLQAIRARSDFRDDGTAVQIFKTFHAPHVGKQSFGRVLSGTVSDGMTLGGEKVNGLYDIRGVKSFKISSASAGAVVALGRMEKVETGDLLTEPGKSRSPFAPEILKPVFALALKPKKTGEEVKLSAAVAKLVEEDPSLQVEFSKDTGQMLLWGQGPVHLETALSRLETRFNVLIEGTKPQIPYKETITKPTKQQGKHKRQSGGHGQYGDVWLEISPLPRGEGFRFSESIVGGAVPRQYFSAVENGIREYLTKGVLGFPVVDIAVNLYDGSYHDVDSSEQAFKTAAQVGMREAMPQCGPVLLEPILAVEISVPSDFTSKAQRSLSQHRGQISGFDRRPGWDGWDTIRAHLPQAEMTDVVTELRSLSMGVGLFGWVFDHLQELVGKDAEKIVQQQA